MISPIELGVEPTPQVTPPDIDTPSGRETLPSLSRAGAIVILCGAILPIALLLRLFSLGARSLDEDEILSVLMARWSWGTFWWMASHIEANMVLYFASLRLWIRLGQSESAIRSFSVIAGLAAVLAMYWLGSRAFGRLVGCLGALLLAINGFHIQYSQDARGYALLLLLVTLSSLFFLRCVREGSRNDWIFYVVTSTLAIYVHVFTVFVLMAHWVSLLFAPRGQAPWKKLALSTVAIAVLALPMELFMLFRRGGQIDWISKTTWQGVYALFACLAGATEQVSRPDYTTSALLLVYSILVAIGVVAFVKARSWSIDHGETWYGVFFLTWLVVPILLILTISIRKPILVTRYLTICLPPFVLLAAYGYSQLRRVGASVALFCVIAGLTAVGLVSYYTDPGQDWRGLAKYILSSEQPGDAALFCPPYFGVRMTHYLNRDPYLERAGGTQSDAYPYGPNFRRHEFDAEPAKASFALASQIALLVPDDDNSYGSLLQNLSSRYGRLWLVERRQEGSTDSALEERSIESTLASEYRGTSTEKLFSGDLEVVLYQKPDRKGSGRQLEPPAVAPEKNVLQTREQQPGSAAGSALVHITSSPSGGEIYVDGKFFGDTPSHIALPSGERIVKITIGGKSWSRSLEITSGEVTLHADMTANSLPDSRR